MLRESLFKVHYKFDCGTGSALLVSERTITDDAWHTVIFKRDGSYGELIVDEDKAEEGYSLGPNTKINVNPPFFVGGVLPEIHSIVYATIVRSISLFARIVWNCENMSKSFFFFRV